MTVATPLPASAELLVSETVPARSAPSARRGDGARRVRVVDEPCVCSRGPVLVADDVARAQLQRVRAVGESGGDRQWRRGADPAAAVQVDLVGGRRLGRGEAERRSRVAARIGRGRREGRVGRSRVDRPGVARLRRVLVAGRVGRAHLEGVRALGQAAVGLRAGARAPGAAVEADVEARAGLGSQMNAKDAPVALVGSAGCEVMFVFGAVVSTVHV